MGESGIDIDAWLEAKEVYGRVREAPPDERASLVESLPSGSPARHALNRLLRQHDSMSGFLEDVTPNDEAPATPSMPTSIGPYTPVERLGEGGFGVVYRAWQRTPVHREVAVKVLKAGLESPQLLARFAGERHFLAKIDHPDIVRVLDAGTSDDGRMFVVMDLVRGEPITDFVRERRPPLVDRARLMIRVIRTVHAVHQRAVIHRDLKPTNILVTEDSDGARPRIIDFGIATAVDDADRSGWTQVGTPIGTPKYASPEQLRGGEGVDTRTDVYSLGVLLCEMLTGCLPREAPLGGESPAIAPSRLVQQGPDSSAERVLRGDLDRIVLKAVSWDPELRYDSASAFADDLGRFLSGEPVLAAPPTRLYVARKFIHRNRVASLLGFAAVVSLVVGFLIALVGMSRAAAGERAAEASTERAAFVGEFLLETLVENADPDVRGAPSALSPEELEELAARALEGAAEDPEMMLEILHKIGTLQVNLGDPRRGAATHRRAMDFAIGHYGVPHERVVDSRLHVVDTVSGWALGSYLAMLETARLEALDLFGEDDPRYLRVWQRGELTVDELEALDRRYRSDESVRPEDEIALLNTLGWRYAFQAESDKLVPLRQRLVDLATEVHGPDQAVSREARVSLADAYLRNGEDERAAEVLKPLVEGAAERYGRDSRRFAVQSSMLAKALDNLGRPADALPHARASLLFGDEGVARANRLAVLGNILSELGELDEASVSLESALAIHREKWRAGHPAIWRCELDLAGTRDRLGDREGAVELLVSAVNRLEPSGKREYEILALASIDLIELLTELGRHDDATGIFVATSDRLRGLPDSLEALEALETGVDDSRGWGAP
ncbi:MAG: serine/threonine-protein kinase [Planctomycetota bacterium]